MGVVVIIMVVKEAKMMRLISLVGDNIIRKLSPMV